MLSLPNGCRCSELNVFPKTWMEKDAPIDEDWYIYYRFYAPGKKGQLVPIKGMNHMHRLIDRRDITKGLLKEERERLLAGYIPPSVKLISPNTHEIRPSTFFIPALDKSYKLLDEKPTKVEVRKALVHIKISIEQCGYSHLEIGSVRQHHLEVVLIQIGKNREAAYEIERRQPKPAKKKRPSRTRKSKKEIPTEWGASAFNHYRSYLLMLFKQIKKVGGTEVKPVEDIEKKKGTKKKREEIEDRELEKVFKFLKEKYYTFYRFVRIYYKGGARIIELMNVKKEDVKLERCCFWVLVKKGSGELEWKTKTITRDVAKLWYELLNEAKEDEDYLFSEDLRPGPIHIAPKQISNRWLWHVKEKLGLKEDINWLRHKNSTEVIDIALARIDAAIAVAAKINGHTNLDMSKKVYDLRAADRLHEEILRMESHG